MFQILFALFFVLSVINSEWLLPASQQAIALWLEKLLPSMFFMMVCLKLVVNWGILKPILRPFRYVFQRLFGLNEHSFALCLNLLLIGYPAGSMMVNEKVGEGKLSGEQGQRLLNCCSCASFGFVWMSVGKVFLNSLKTGIQCWLIQIVISLLLLFLTRKQRCYMGEMSENIHVIDDFKIAIKESLNAMFQILGYVMMALCIGAIFLRILPSQLAMVVQPLIEFSNGCYMISQSGLAMGEMAMLMSMLIAFGGFCVHLQIVGFVDAFSFNYFNYLLFRLLAVGLAFLLSLFIF